MRLWLFISVALSGATLWAEKLPFDRYQSIIDRQMFGEPPPGFDPTRPPSEVTKAEQKELSKEQEKLQSSVQFSVINVTPGGETMVGFTDNSVQPPKSYYLKVGEIADGWEVKSADPVAAKMVIAKNEIEVSLTIGENSAKAPNATAKATPAAAAANLSTPRKNGVGAFHGGATTRFSGLDSLKTRRLQRQQDAAALAAQAAAEKAARDQERAEREEREAEDKAQREAEKAQHEAEMAEQRRQLLSIQEKLKEVQAAKSAEKDKGEADKTEAEENEGEGAEG